MVDDEDYLYLSKRSWHAKENRWGGRVAVHACTTINGATVRMSRVITNAPLNFEVDHRNRNTLDNRRCNLRLASSIQNQENQGIRLNKHSQFKGVSRTRYGRWTCRITVNKSTIHIGNFITELDAAKAYDTAAVKYFGKFARTDKMEGLLE